MFHRNLLQYHYKAIKGAYHSVPRAALDYLITVLFSLYQTTGRNLKSAKLVLRTWTKKLTNEADQDLKACFDLTDWSVFEAAANDLDELTETVTSYISFCEDMCISNMTRLTYNNDKPWFTAKLRQLFQAKKDAYRKRDIVLYKQANYTLEKEIKVAKRNYSGKLRNKFSSSDFASVCKDLKDIKNYKTPSPSTLENQQLADDFNDFYCRFGKTNKMFWRSSGLCSLPTALLSVHF